jgi:HlyD family secretion protein
MIEYQTRIETCEKEFQRIKSLYEKEVVAMMEYEKKEAELSQLLKERDYYSSQKKLSWQQQILQYKTELQTLIANRDQLRFEKRFLVVIAPANGYISNFIGLQTGSFILPNQSIATINPTENLIVECYVSPSDIGYLDTGKIATFQLDAYNYNQWGQASGQIFDISNQPYLEKETVFFKVKCKLDQEHLTLKSGCQGKLKNGMTLTSRFVVNRRSLFDLLFDKADDWLNPKIINH